MNTAAADHYVTCDECGHALERHDSTGCHGADGCPCPVRVTATDVAAARRAAGLSARFDRRTI